MDVPFVEFSVLDKNLAAIGAAVAFERYEIALLLSAASFATLRWLARFEDARTIPPGRT